MSERSSSPDLSIADAARKNGVHPATIRRYIANGTLPAYRVGARLIRLRADEVEAALVRRIPTVDQAS